MVVLCACRDHILRGILPFPTIPFYTIQPSIIERVLQWKEGGVGMVIAFNTKFDSKPFPSTWFLEINTLNFRSFERKGNHVAQKVSMVNNSTWNDFLSTKETWTIVSWFEHGPTAEPYVRCRCRSMFWLCCVHSAVSGWRPYTHRSPRSCRWRRLHSLWTMYSLLPRFCFGY